MSFRHLILHYYNYLKVSQRSGVNLTQSFHWSFSIPTEQKTTGFLMFSESIPVGIYFVNFEQVNAGWARTRLIQLNDELNPIQSHVV